MNRPPTTRSRRTVTLMLIVALGPTACERAHQTELPRLSGGLVDGTVPPRINGAISGPSDLAPLTAYGNRTGSAPRLAVDEGNGQYSLDFADTDVREVVAQVMGGMLRLNYSLDPGVKGTVTLRTSRPLTTGQLLPALQTMLGSVGAAIVQTEGLYRIVPAASAGGAGSMVVPLHYVAADELAKVLQSVAGPNVKIAAETALNVLLISGGPGQVQSMAELVRSFDIDALAGQSYAVLPVGSGNAKDFADSMQEAFRGKAGGGLSGLVRVVPLAKLNAVLIVSTQPAYIDQARRIFAVIDRQRRATTRTWQVFYLQNSDANDLAYTLQSAFTPGHVTAVPASATRDNRLANSRSGLGGPAGGNAAGGLGGRTGGGTAAGLNGAISGANPLIGGGGPPSAPSGSGLPPANSAALNPLLGGLDDVTDTIRILPNAQNNAILIYGTGQEQEPILAMLRKVDILPLQVLIDATIAEVTLNDSLQFGTQFFFKSGGLNGILSAATASNPATLAASAFGLNLPGFILGSPSAGGPGGAPFAISALQAVTTVRVLSSPQITVVDNQQARLQVGALVPYLTASSQSTLTPNAPVINSIAYQPTGVIMEVTPRVNSGGLVTLDVSQEVSDVQTNTTTSGINSPTFNQRSVTSRVVVQDGQTIGLAGLIRDTDSHGNSGLPWLKDIPILGALAGTQNNSRQRTELLVMITPHVIRSQTDVRSLTEDMRAALRDAATVPLTARNPTPSGSDDPNRRLRERVRRSLVR
jgi:general secretion pathway protein D